MILLGIRLEKKDAMAMKNWYSTYRGSCFGRVSEQDNS